MTAASGILSNLMFTDTTSVKESSAKFPEASTRAKDARFRSVLKDQASKIRPQDSKKSVASAEEDTKDEAVTDETKNLAAFLYGMVPFGMQEALAQAEGSSGTDGSGLFAGGLLENGQLQELENLLNQKAAELLKMNAEALQNMQKEMGMKAADLLDAAQLQQLFLKAEGVSDPMQLITNEELSAGLLELNQGIRKALEEGSKQLAGKLNENPNDLMDASKLSKELAGDMQELSETLAGTNLTDEQKIGKSDNSLAEGRMAAAEEGKAPIVEISNQRMPQSNANTQENPASKEQMSSQEAVTEESVPMDQQLLNHLSDGVSQARNFVPAPDAAVPQAADIINQMVDRIKLVVREDMTTMDMELHPESLGKVHIQVADREGVMTAQIAVQSEEARRAVEQNITMLQDSFKNQNLKVDAVEVMVNYQGFDQRSSQEQRGSKEQDKALPVGRRRPFVSFNDADVDETKTNKSDILLNREDSSVEYMA